MQDMVIMDYDANEYYKKIEKMKEKCFFTDSAISYIGFRKSPMAE